MPRQQAKDDQPSTLDACRPKRRRIEPNVQQRNHPRRRCPAQCSRCSVTKEQEKEEESVVNDGQTFETSVSKQVFVNTTKTFRSESIKTFHSFYGILFTNAHCGLINLTSLGIHFRYWGLSSFGGLLSFSLCLEVCLHPLAAW